MTTPNARVICIAGFLPENCEKQALAVVPRVATEAAGGRLWADGPGLDALRAAHEIVRRLSQGGAAVRAGVSNVPVAAWAAASTGSGDVVQVPSGEERTFLAPLPLTVLEPDDRIRLLLEGAGVECCHHLACLEREAVEVRFGPDAVTATP